MENKILHTNNPLFSVLMMFKNICTKKIEIGGEKYEYGDFVYDTKNNEYGIFLGIKPVDIRNHPESLDAQIENLVKKPGNSTSMILTLSKDENNSYITRIRYTNSRFLSKVMSDKKVDTTTDLDKYCKNICFMDCSKDCPLWKYGCWKA